LEYVIVTVVALFAAFMALFSGFGLGSLLTPAFVFFFPVSVAVAATAIVHLLNNIFRGILTAKHANFAVVVRFGFPAILTAVGGATLLGWLSSEGMPLISSYQIGKTYHELTIVKLVIGVVIIAFGVLDLMPRFQKFSFPRKWLPLAGLISGFFGGLSGNQGALRAAALVKVGLQPKAFISTNAICAVLVDLARLAVYGITFYTTDFAAIGKGGNIPVLVGVATLAAFLGSYLGFKNIAKVTVRIIHLIIGIMLICVGAALATGLI